MAPGANNHPRGVMSVIVRGFYVVSVVTSPLRVLLVEDSETDALLVMREFRRRGYAPTFERVEDPVAMRAALEGGPWDVVLSDWSMPQFTAPEALSILR